MNFSYDRKRNPLFNPMHQNYANYSTDMMSKSELHRDFGEELFLNNLHLIPDPLKKNLADTIITSEKSQKPQKQKQKEEISPKMSTEDLQESINEGNSPLSGIFSFFTGVFNSLSGAMFRPKSPVYYDCYTPDSDWQISNTEADKNGPVQSPVMSENASNMSSEVRTAAKTCEGKLNQIRYVLTPKQTTGVWFRKRPKKVFIEPGSVEENYEDAFAPEDFISMPNQTFIECYSSYTYQKEELYQTGAPKTKVEPPRTENIDIVHVTDEEKQENSVLKDKQSLECGKGSLNLDKVETENLQKEKNCLSSEETKLNLEKQNEDKMEIDTKQNKDSKTDSSEKPISNNEYKNSIVENININVENKESNVENINTNVENKDLNVENTNSNKVPTDKSIDEVDYSPTDKQTIITSCEDKLSKLKALLCKNKKSRPTYINLPEDNLKTTENISSMSNSTPTYVSENTKPQCTYMPKNNCKTKAPNSMDKHYKNPHRTTDKRKKSRQKKNINDDILFANELESEFIDESPLNSFTQTCLGDYFDEVTGRFRTASATDSDDSFQIVFNDTPRVRIPSECESEDSFIIFEDSPDSCYTSNDVFGDSDTESDSDVSDSGCSTLTCKLSHSLSRTVSNLTDDSLYAESGDEIDSTNIETVLKCDEVNKCLLDDEVRDLLVDDETDRSSVETVLKCDEVSKSLLIDDDKKKSRRNQPAKTVHFSNDPPKIHLMRVWAFAARQARAGHWERYAIDRERFKRRIADVDVAVSWVLKPQHRSRVMFQRFMPWWNAQKRRELAEKKQREELKKQEELEAKELAEKQMAEERIKQELLQQEELEKQELENRTLEKHELEKRMEEETIKGQGLIEEELMQHEVLEKPVPEIQKEQELLDKQSEELIISEELLQQQMLERRELSEKRMEDCNIKNEQCLQKEFESKELETNLEELSQQEFLQHQEESGSSKPGELTKQDEFVNNEEPIQQELVKQQELLRQKELIQQKMVNSSNFIAEAKNDIIPLYLQNGENSQINSKNLAENVRTLDSCNKKSYSSNCADFDKTQSKERNNNQILS